MFLLTGTTGLQYSSSILLWEAHDATNTHRVSVVRGDFSARSTSKQGNDALKASKASKQQTTNSISSRTQGTLFCVSMNAPQT
jgi:hypothetical protein